MGQGGEGSIGVAGGPKVATQLWPLQPYALLLSTTWWISIIFITFFRLSKRGLYPSGNSRKQNIGFSSNEMRGSIYILWHHQNITEK